jgi:DNA-binding transcriptional MerR regulator
MWAGMNPLDILRAHSSFNGNREDLAADATVLKEELGLAGEGPSVRIIRHYEQIGCISKTVFAGNLPGPNGEPPARPTLMPPEKSPYNVYVYRHLLEVTAIRVLLQDGWQLRRIAEFLLGARTNDAVEQLIIARGQFGGRRRPSDPAGAEPTPHADLAAAKAALDLLAGFREAAGTPRALPAAAAAPAAPRRTSEYQPASWLRITIDEDAKAKAGPANVARALAEATALLASLNV